MRFGAPGEVGDAILEETVFQFADLRGAEMQRLTFNNVQIVLDTHENAVVLSKKALVFEDEQPHVFVVIDGTAERRSLELGYQDSERVEITSGVAPGESVVLVGQSALKEGSGVEVQGAETGHADGNVASGGPADAGSAQTTP